MPSSVNINGLRIYRPGIYAIIDASALGGKGISTGNVAVVGDFPELEHGGNVAGNNAATSVKPLTFTSAQAIKAFIGSDKKWLDISKLAFAPSTDGRIPGGVTSLTFVNQVPNTQATTNGYGGFQDSTGKDVIQLQSRYWGKKGNQIFVDMKTNASTSSAIDTTLSFDGKSETYSALESGPVADFWYDGGDLNASFTRLSADGIRWDWIKELSTTATGNASTNKVVWEPTKLVINGKLGLSMANGAAGNESTAKTITIVGLNSTGAATTEVLRTNSGNTDNYFYALADSGYATVLQETVTLWSRIDSVTYEGGTGSWNGKLSLFGTAFDISASDFVSIGSMVTYINNNKSKGFNAEGQHTRINTIPSKPSVEWPYAGGFDYAHGMTNGAGSKLTGRADLWQIVSALDESQFVKCKAETPAARKATGQLLIGATATKTNLNGVTFTLKDPAGGSQQFTFNSSNDVVTSGNVGTSSAGDVATLAARIASAVNDNSVSVGVTATASAGDAGSWQVLLTQDTAGATGNGFEKLLLNGYAGTIPAWNGATTLPISIMSPFSDGGVQQLPPKMAGGGADSDTFLMGGKEGSATSDSVSAAYQAVEAADIQIVVPFPDSYGATTSTRLDHQQKAVRHCVDSAIAGYERNAWAGADAGNTVKELFDTYSKKLNSRHIALVGQEAQMVDSKGNLVWFAPDYLALQFAAMQAGSPVATPLTWKRPSLVDVRQKWNPNLDAGEAISKGLCVLSRDTLGWKIERSVTTYMEDDNPIYSEVSSMESVNTSVRHLRNQLLIQIGNPVYANTAPKMSSKVNAVLDRQVLDGIIKAYQNVVLEDLGDTIRITYELAAVEPLNFIIVMANVTRISSTA